MIRYIVTGFILLLASQAAGIESELIPGDSGGLSGETELFWDDGEDNGFFFAGECGPFATTFTAPFDCKLIKYRLYWANVDPSQANNQPVDCYLYEDISGVPDTAAVFTVTGNSGTTADREWLEIDVSGENILLSAGTVFHPGWDFGYVTPPFWGVYLDDNKAQGTCWTTATTSGDWIEWSGYTHMVRVVVDDMLSLQSTTWGALKAAF